jgi:hypothetical protein
MALSQPNAAGNEHWTETMTSHLQTAAYDRRAIMRDAHKRFRDGRRLGIDWTFVHCLRTAWAAARIRRGQDVTADTMRRIASMIEDHLSRRITLAPEIGRGKNHETHPMGFRLSRADNHRASRDGRRPVC